MNVYHFCRSVSSEWYVLEEDIIKATQLLFNEVDVEDLEDDEDGGFDIRRLTDEEMDEKEISCCHDDKGCDLCNEKQDVVLLSYRELATKKGMKPCILAYVGD